MSRNLFDIIVADDDEPTRDTLAEVLREEGYFVVTAASSQEVLDLLKEQHWDLIISDVRRPGDMNGIEMVKAIRAMGNAIPVILVTGFKTIETAVEAMKAGATDFFGKPFTAQQLFESIRAALAVKTRIYQGEIVYSDWPTKH